MSRSDKKSRPLRKLLFLAVLAGIIVAIKNAIEDKGGSYEAPTAPQPSSAPVPTPPVPTIEKPEQRPVENLDEFADPVAPDDEPLEPESVPEPAPVEEPAVAEAPKRRARTQPPTAADTQAESTLPEAPKEDADLPGKIDPFGIR